MYSEMLYDGIVVDLGAGVTQISPVVDGYTSQFCSTNYEVTGKKVDEYLFKLLYSNYHKDGAYDDRLRAPASKIDPFWLYKVKMDIKETGCSPYSIPFNKEVLDARKIFNKADETAYEDYMLPDGNTIMSISQGNTEGKIYDYLEYLYLDPSQLK